MRATSARRPGLDAAAFIWGFAEATFFFVVPDVLLSFIVVRRGLRPAVWATAAAVAGATFGGMLMWNLGLLAPDWTREALDVVPAISPAMIGAAAPAMSNDLLASLLAGAISGVPFKVYATEAPGVGIGWLPFLLAGIAARTARFAGVVLVTAALDRAVAPHIGPRGRTGILVGFWLLFYVVFWSTAPG